MSTNGWKPRQIATLTCPSGQEVQVRRPGPDTMMKVGRVIRGFARNAGLTEQEAALSLAKDLADMSDEELATIMISGRELICATLVSPKLVLNPRPDMGEIGPDDMPFPDFLFLFTQVMGDFYQIKVPVGETEVEVADLETFRTESGVSRDRVDGASIPSNSEQPNGDQGLVDSAGA